MSAVGDDRILKNVVARLSFFVFCEKVVGGKKKKFFGAEAVTALLEDAVSKNAESTCKPAEVDFLRAWRYLIPKSKLATADSLLKDIDAADTTARSIGGKKSGRSGIARDTKKQDAAVAEAMSLFS